MKQRVVLLTVAMLATFSPVWAELKLAVFDAAEVMANTNAAKRAAETLETRVSTAQSRINQLEKPLLEKQKKLREQAAVMTPDKAREAQMAFNKELAEFRQQAQSIQSSLESENLKLRKRITDGVKTVVAQLAQEKKFDIILPKGLIFYSSPAIPDVTQDVLARTNALLDK